MKPVKKVQDLVFTIQPFSTGQDHVTNKVDNASSNGIPQLLAVDSNVVQLDLELECDRYTGLLWLFYVIDT